MQTLHNNVIRRDRPLNHEDGGRVSMIELVVDSADARNKPRRVRARRRSLIGTAQRVIMRILLGH